MARRSGRARREVCPCLASRPSPRRDRMPPHVPRLHHGADRGDFDRGIGRNL